jgi:futalosine hydrolase
MRIAVFAASTAELSGFISKKDKAILAAPFPIYQKRIKQHSIDFIISGIGLVSSAFAAGCINWKNYDLVINAGIAGSFDKKIKLGDCVIIKEERIIDLGAEDSQNWLRLKDMGLDGIDTISLNVEKLPTKVIQHFKELKQVKALSSNTAHGNEKSIQNILSLYKAKTESMEGAAIAYAALRFKKPLLQIRSISNYVEKRNRKNWDIPLAVSQLNQLLNHFFNTL